VLGVLATLIGAVRRRRRCDAHLHDELGMLGERLDTLVERIERSTRRSADLDAGLGDAIGSTIDLGEVLRRTLAATGAVRAVDGSEIEVVAEDGERLRESKGAAVNDRGRPVGGPPDGRAFRSATIAFDYEGTAPDAIRSALSVPLQAERELGLLTVYSSIEAAFGADAVETLSAVARRATPAVANALRHRAVERLAVTDELTGLLNRRGYDRALEREILVARRTGRPLALMIIDLDLFSRVNNDYGLPAGDAVLVTFAECLRTAVRAADIACRRGGEEFAIVLPETNCQQGVLAYNRLRAVVAGTEFPYVGTITFSAGLSDLRDADTAADVDQRAAEGEQRAKQQGRDQLQIDCLEARLGQ